MALRNPSMNITTPATISPTTHKTKFITSPIITWPRLAPAARPISPNIRDIRNQMTRSMNPSTKDHMARSLPRETAPICFNVNFCMLTPDPESRRTNILLPQEPYPVPQRDRLLEIQPLRRGHHLLLEHRDELLFLLLVHALGDRRFDIAVLGRYRLDYRLGGYPMRLVEQDLFLPSPIRLIDRAAHSIG